MVLGPPCLVLCLTATPLHLDLPAPVVASFIARSSHSDIIEPERKGGRRLFDDLICGSDLVDGALRLGLRWIREDGDRQFGWMGR
jgi:hypothetical protein